MRNPFVPTSQTVSTVLDYYFIMFISGYYKEIALNKKTDKQKYKVGGATTTKNSANKFLIGLLNMSRNVYCRQGRRRKRDRYYSENE